MRSYSLASSFCPILRRTVSALGLLALLGSAALPAAAQTLTFDTLPAAPGVSGSAFLVDANSGSRTLSGVTFNASDNADWEIVGSQYQAPSSSDFFAAVQSGDYALAGNAYSGMDFFGNSYDGLTISTSKALTSLYLGFDDNGGGANDADTVTITAFGAGGDIASGTAILHGPALSLLDTSGAFSGLLGVTGYRFETTASNDLYAAAGQAYLIADDITFGTPVPEASTTVSLGLLLGLGVVAAARRNKGAKAA